MKSHEINLDGLSVCIGIPSTRDINALTVKSLFATQNLCLTMGIKCQLAIVANNAVVQWARDEIIDLFLKTDANRLFMIDSDIMWEPNDFMKMMALSQVRDVVCASYPAKIDQPTYYIRYDEKAPLTGDEYGLLEIMGCGLGFTIIRRNVVENVVRNSEKLYDEITKREIASVFHVGRFNNSRRGEDMSFFESIMNLGYKIYLDPSIELGHIGSKTYKGKAADALVVTDNA